MIPVDRARAGGTKLVAFEGVSQPVGLEDGEALLRVFESVFRYWPHDVLPQDSAVEPLITVRPGENGRYFLEAPWLEKPARYSNAVNLACGLGVHINQAFLGGPGDYLCLHAAAARIGGRLVIFPNAYRAGKSTLTVCLAAAGARIFCDDILPVTRDSGVGLALGIAPRLRLPWPESLSPETVDFIRSRRGAENSQYLYVDLEPAEQAPFAETAPIGGIVVLNRRDGERARLERIGVGEALKHVVLRNFARKVPLSEALERLHEILLSAFCARLTFSDGDEAAALLVRQLSEWDGLDVGGAAARPAGPPELPVVDPLPPNGGAMLRRRDGVRERIADGELFLVDSSEQGIFHLNPIGTGLWRLLDGHCDIGEAVSILDEAFPEAGRDKIERDVRRLVSELIANGLLVRAGPSGSEQIK